MPSFYRAELPLRFQSDIYLEVGALATVELRLYRDARRMRTAIKARDRKLGVVEDVPKVQGMFSPVTVTGFSKTGAETTLPSLGILWLHREALGAGVVSHECFHLACQWMRRLPGHDELVLGAECGAPEELLAYLLTEAVRTVFVHLRDVGAIPG